jgi:hypothetical protein
LYIEKINSFRDNWIYLDIEKINSFWDNWIYLDIEKINSFWDNLNLFGHSGIIGFI